MSEAHRLQSITIACPDCDLLNRLPELAPGESARCRRCDCTLSRCSPNCINRVLALNFSAIVLYVIACYFPFLSFGKNAMVVETHLISGIISLASTGMYALAAAVAFTTLIVPSFVMFGLCYLLIDPLCAPGAGTARLPPGIPRRASTPAWAVSGTRRV